MWPQRPAPQPVLAAALGPWHVLAAALGSEFVLECTQLTAKYKIL